MKDREGPVTDAYLDKLLREEISATPVRSDIPIYGSTAIADPIVKYAPCIKPTFTSSERNSIEVDKLTIGQHDLGTFIENVEKHLGLGEYAPKTNLRKVQSYNAEQLAYFIVHISKTIISGSGDAVQELTEWFNTKTE